MADKKPVPVPTLESQQYWDAALEGKLMIQHCQDCGSYIFYPRSVCDVCHSNNLEWKQASGKGKIYSYSVVYRPVSKAFEADVPYAVAIIELDEGVHMLSNIVEIEPEGLYIGMPVEVIFEERSESIKMPMFKPCK